MRIAVLGAGVSGLTSAVVLSESGHDVAIYAREIENTTSHAAAAIWYPYHIASEHAARWAEETRAELVALIGERDAGVSLIDFDTPDGRIRVPLADTRRYLPYMRRRFGGTIVQRTLTRGEVAELDCDAIVNCTGFGARELFGDDALSPGYGIAVVVDRSPVERALVSYDPLIYVIPRADDCVLGGYDAPDPPDASEAAAIVERCRAAVPEVNGTIRQVREGIRPVRPSVRLEMERVAGKVLVHNYGHGGAGFTVSWGCAREVARLLKT